MLTAALLIAAAALPVQTLDGVLRAYPADAAAPRSIFVVSYSKAGSKQASAWTKRLMDERAGIAASLFQVAVMDDVPKLFRSMAISGMSHDVPIAMHDHFWIVSTGGADWRALAEPPSTKEASVFVVEGREKVVWKGHGEPSEAAVRELLGLFP
ncbi:MAG TPA: hypothetical protein VFV19_12410 [Candidatus Polarisedimenticolaceae bacterium]|nr:hypothetical protein [Candidatus Polarisedimenticolaceae bacterium]